MALDDTRIAHQDRLARRTHGGVERGLEADLRPDPGRIAGGDGDLGFSRGMSAEPLTQSI